MTTHRSAAHAMVLARDAHDARGRKADWRAELAAERRAGHWATAKNEDTEE